MKRWSNTILTKFVETDIMRSLYSGNKNGNIPFEENLGRLTSFGKSTYSLQSFR